MVKQQVDLKNGEDEKVNRLSKQWNLNKPETILKIIKLFPEEFIPDLIEMDKELI